MYMSYNLLNSDDFTLYQSGGKLMSGDFEISINNQSGGSIEGVSEGGKGNNSLLQNLAMPLYYFSKGKGKKKYHKYDEEEGEEKGVIDNDIFDKLLKMVEYKNDEKTDNNKIKKRGTKKHKDLIKKKKTRKN